MAKLSVPLLASYAVTVTLFFLGLRSINVHVSPSTREQIVQDINPKDATWYKRKFTEPRLGRHRPHVDAVITMSVGYSLEKIIYFITSLVETGYEGDLVMGVKHPIEDDPELMEFLVHYTESHNVVVYEVSFECCCPRRGWLCKVLGDYNDTATTSTRGDPRPHRHRAVIRYEFYYEWASRYSKGSRILVTDSRDVFFQLPPFSSLPAKMENSLIMFDSGASKDPNSAPNPHNSMKIIESLPDANWIKNAYNMSTLNEIRSKPSSCSGTTIGGQPAIMIYARAMVDQFDYTYRTNGANGNFDQAFHNVLLHKNLLSNYSSGPLEVKLHATGEPFGVVRTMGQEFHYRYKDKPLDIIPFPFKNSSGEGILLNYDGSVPSVVHQADRHEELRKMIERRTIDAIKKFKEAKVDLKSQ